MKIMSAISDTLNVNPITENIFVGLTTSTSDNGSVAIWIFRSVPILDQPSIGQSAFKTATARYIYKAKNGKQLVVLTPPQKAKLILEQYIQTLFNKGLF